MRKSAGTERAGNGEDCLGGALTDERHNRDYIIYEPGPLCSLEEEKSSCYSQ